MAEHRQGRASRGDPEVRSGDGRVDGQREGPSPEGDAGEAQLKPAGDRCRHARGGNRERTGSIAQVEEWRPTRRDVRRLVAKDEVDVRGRHEQAAGRLRDREVAGQGLAEDLDLQPDARDGGERCAAALLFTGPGELDADGRVCPRNRKRLVEVAGKAVHAHMRVAGDRGVAEADGLRDTLGVECKCSAHAVDEADRRVCEQDSARQGVPVAVRERQGPVAEENRHARPGEGVDRPHAGDRARRVGDAPVEVRNVGNVH